SDGQLDADEARRIAQRFATDAAAQKVAHDLHQTQDMLEAWAKPMPAVDWKAMQARISGAVRREAALQRRRSAFRWAGGFAIAASLILLVLLGRSAFRRPQPHLTPSAPPIENMVVVEG